MSAHRTFEDIFESLQNLAELRQQEETNTLPHKKDPKCLCGKNEYSISSDDNSEDNDSEGADESEPIYIEQTSQGFRYAVCPACNPRLHCVLCEGTGHKVLSQVHIFETDEGELEYISEDISPNSCSCTHTERLVTLLNKAEIPNKYVNILGVSGTLETLHA